MVGICDAAPSSEDVEMNDGRKRLVVGSAELNFKRDYM
jgi:hypothetical protein